MLATLAERMSGLGLLPRSVGRTGCSNSLTSPTENPGKELANLEPGEGTRSLRTRGRNSLTENPEKELVTGPGANLSC
jgi:hypothetical protein